MSGSPTLRPLLLTERGRLLDGMARAAAAFGYRATWVCYVARAGDLPRRAFYAHFASREACFLAAYDLGVDRAAHEVAIAFTGSDGDWTIRIRRAFERFLALVVAEPAFARLCLVEVHAAGPRALARRTAALDRFATIIERSARSAPGHPPTPPALPEAIVGGVQALVRARLSEGRIAELPALADDLPFWGLVPFLGHPAGPAAPLPARERSPRDALAPPSGVGFARGRSHA
jgi:AcrR family transcriptional regulator